MRPGYEGAVTWTNGWSGRWCRVRWRKWRAYLIPPQGYLFFPRRHGKTELNAMLSMAMIGVDFPTKAKAVRWLQGIGRYAGLGDGQ